MDDQMTYPHEPLEERVRLLEAAVARINRDFADLQRRGASALNTTIAPEVDKWTQEWIASWDDKGRPIARIATPIECRKVGGGGKGDWDGDPTVKFDPKFWKQESWVGRTFSQCPPEYLDMHASNDEYRAFKYLGDPEKKKWAKYQLRSAALAKGWARMLREDPGLARAWQPGDANDANDANEDFPF